MNSPSTPSPSAERVGPMLHALGVICRATPHFRGKWRVLKWCFDHVLKGARKTDIIRLNRHTVMQCNFCSDYGVWSQGKKYEGTEAGYFRSLLKPGMTFFDVGANVGYYSLVAAPLLGETGEIHCFEPVSQMFEMLRGNLERNRFRMAVANRFIVSDSPGQKTIHLAPEDNCGASSVTIIQQADDRIETVESITLDDHIRLRGVKRVDVVKIDAEGSELAVLKGARAMLAEKRPVLMIEVRERLLRQSGASRAEIYSLLTEAGYAAYKIVAPDRVEPITEPCDGALIVFKPSKNQ